jgi:hypothetical protein
MGIAAEVDRHTRLVTNNPRIVTRPDRGNVARADLALLSDPQARSLDPLSLSGPFGRVNVAVRVLADAGLVISATTHLHRPSC